MPADPPHSSGATERDPYEADEAEEAEAALAAAAPDIPVAAAALPAVPAQAAGSAAIMRDLAFMCDIPLSDPPVPRDIQFFEREMSVEDQVAEAAATAASRERRRFLHHPDVWERHAALFKWKK